MMRNLSFNVPNHGAVRRKLRFGQLEDAVADAQDLLEHGYEQAGNWNLAQCCRHLSLLMLYPIDGFPPFPVLMRIPMWVLRHTYAPRLLARILKEETWPEGIPTDRNSVPAPSGTDESCVAELRDAVDRLLGHEGPLKPSPLLGLLDKPTLIKLHRIHAAHHLGFLVPANGSE